MFWPSVLFYVFHLLSVASSTSIMNRHRSYSRRAANEPALVVSGEEFRQWQRYVSASIKSCKTQVELSEAGGGLYACYTLAFVDVEAGQFGAQIILVQRTLPQTPSSVDNSPETRSAASTSANVTGLSTASSQTANIFSTSSSISPTRTPIIIPAIPTSTTNSTSNSTQQTESTNTTHQMASNVTSSTNSTSSHTSTAITTPSGSVSVSSLTTFSNIKTDSSKSNSLSVLPATASPKLSGNTANRTTGQHERRQQERISVRVSWPDVSSVETPALILPNSLRPLTLIGVFHLSQILPANSFTAPDITTDSLPIRVLVGPVGGLVSAIGLFRETTQDGILLPDTQRRITDHQPPPRTAVVEKTNSASSSTEAVVSTSQLPSVTQAAGPSSLSGSSRIRKVIETPSSSASSIEVFDHNTTSATYAQGSPFGSSSSPYPSSIESQNVVATAENANVKPSTTRFPGRKINVKPWGIGLVVVILIAGVVVVGWVTYRRRSARRSLAERLEAQKAAGLNTSD